MKRFTERCPLDALLPDEPEQQARGRIQLYAFSRDWSCPSDILGDCIVPKGTITDLASIPPLVWNIISPEDPRILMPSARHDRRYDTNVDRELADKELIEGMEACGAGPVIRALVYRAVRAFGGSHFKANA